MTSRVVMISYMIKHSVKVYSINGMNLIRNDTEK